MTPVDRAALQAQVPRAAWENPLMRMLLLDQAVRGKVCCQRTGDYIAVGVVRGGSFAEEYRAESPALARAYARARICGVAAPAARAGAAALARGERGRAALPFSPLDPGADPLLVAQALAEAPLLERWLLASPPPPAQRAEMARAAADGILSARLALFILAEHCL